MRIEDVNVSEDCRRKLKRAGFTMVEEIVGHLNRARRIGNTGYITWITCIDEIVDELIGLGLWSEHEKEDASGSPN